MQTHANNFITWAFIKPTFILKMDNFGLIINRKGKKQFGEKAIFSSNLVQHILIGKVKDRNEKNDTLI